MKINVALLQMTSAGKDQDKNRAKGDDFCRQASRMGADIALFPEMWNIGYSFLDPNEPGASQAWAAMAVGMQGEFVRHFKKLAKELDMAIGLTYLEKWQGAPRNTISLIDRFGEIQMTYAKVHTCDFDREAALTPGNDFTVCELDTANGVVKVGAMICYDREFPESARVLMLKGAELILTPNACTLGIHRISQFRTRAFENMVAVAMANYAAPEANGHSVAYGPVAYDINENMIDNLVIEAGDNEGVYLAEFDMTKIRAYRQRETWGNAFRKPGAYGLLVSPDVHPPFLRDCVILPGGSNLQLYLCLMTGGEFPDRRILNPSWIGGETASSLGYAPRRYMAGLLRGRQPETNPTRRNP